MSPQWSADIVYFPNQLAPTADERERLAARGIDVVDGEVARLVVDNDRLSGVELTDGQLTTLGCAADENGWVTTDATGHTSVPGVWAAGNVVDPRAQVITAAGAGSAAAIAINAYLLDDDIDRAVRLPLMGAGYGKIRPA